MRISLRIGTLLFPLMLINGPGNAPEPVNACCSDGGSCTGSAYCTACTNCSGCKHCNSGGSCGVCAGGSTRSRSSGTRSSNNLYSTPASTQGGSSSGNASQENTPHSGTALILIVVSQELNLRAGPNSEFEVLELLTLGDQLIYLGKEGVWIHVETPKGKKGYVYYKNVQIYNN